MPHPSAFHDRLTNQFGLGGSYLDGLALTDLAMGRLQEELKSSLLWPRTSVIICGDHSFRVHMYESTRYWTAEDERVTNGVFEPNPLVMIHNAGQQTSATVNTPTSLMVVHSALENMLRH